ncbi:hypothetical protein O3G_MSEX000301 [Manduca sexta]|nr:hypothetical protein O3G_MSEX000301 [Manduca sexta]
MAYKLPKINTNPYPAVRVSGSQVGYSSPDSKLTLQKSSVNTNEHSGHFRGRELYLKTGSELARATKFCQPYSTQGPFTLPPIPGFSQTVQTDQTSGEKATNPLCDTRPKLVAERDRAQYGLSSKKGNYSFPHHRCIGCRLGCPTKWGVLGQEVDITPAELAFQRKGIVRSFCGHRESAGKFVKCAYPSAVRQSYTSGVYKKSRWHSLNSTAKSHQQASGANRAAQHNAVGMLPPGEAKRHCRPPVEGSASTRVALVTPGHGGHIQTMGSSGYRPVRIRKHRRRYQLRHAGFTRWISSILRRIQSRVGLQSCLGVSTTQSNSQSSIAPQYREGSLHSDSTPVDPMLLVTRPTNSSNRGSNNHIAPAEGTHRSDHQATTYPGGQDTSPGLEGWGWSEHISHWSVDEQKLLNSSWRSSTLETYKAPIKRWQSWCKSNDTNDKSPKGEDIARFLANLFLKENLAFNTILLHKSAIFTHCRPWKENYNKNFFIQQILKAISLARIPTKKTPIWDTKILFDWLLATPHCETLFDISRRTALILLLASGRRIHDLTLLEVTEESLVIENDKIILWPKFGSKTDTGTHQQSGWLLLKNQNVNICPVRHVMKLLKISKNRRASGGNIISLFISIMGVIKPASRTIIAGWIRSIFREVKIDAPPGSIRSAVASKSWVEDRPVQEILDRGNWRSMSTFTNHYCRRVQRRNDHSEDLLQRTFSVI